MAKKATTKAAKTTKEAKVKVEVSDDIKDIYLNSYNQPEIKMSDECVNFLNNLRSWMFKNVYISDKTKHREAQVKQIVVDLFNYYKEKECEQLAIDYVAGMSDEFALKTHKELFNGRNYISRSNW